jgi:hypothetical protein
MREQGGKMAKVKTCIVCGGPAGSNEHVFPAGFGGRRTNRGIYCNTHDQSYAGLLGELAAQFDFLNASLGVRPDHSTEKKVVYEREPVSGTEIAMSEDFVKFNSPRLVSETPIENGTAVSITFPDQKSAEEWIKAQEAAGKKVSESQLMETRFFPGPIRYRRSFGGNSGLGAFAYVMQTFFAQTFHEVARSGALSDFIAFTQAVAAVVRLGGSEESEPENEDLKAARSALELTLQPFGGALPVWWDFDVPHGLAPNAFDFGHRVTVGMDQSDGQLYGRVSLFSTFHFAACLGKATIPVQSCEVITDIDPLAELAGKGDSHETRVANADSRVCVPEDRTAELTRAIGDGTQQRRFHDLGQRILNRQLAKLASRMAAALAPGAHLPDHERHALVERVVDQESQQVWRLANGVAEQLAERFRQDQKETIAKLFELLVAPDRRSASGLSTAAQGSLALAKIVLASQMTHDWIHGVLDENRIADLMGRGPGMALIGQALSAPVLTNLHS